MSAFSWLGMLYVDRKFFDKIIAEASIKRIRGLLDD
jgi:hypothetical protein